MMDDVTTEPLVRAVASVVAALALVATASESAFASEPEEAKARCKASYERAQVLQREEKLGAARVQLGICQETCPAPLARECASWETTLDALGPTVRLRGKDATGNPTADVRLMIDGAPAERVDVPIAGEPGAHVFRVEGPGGSAAEVRVEVHAGEREHPVDVLLAPPPELGSVPTPANERRPPSRAPSYIAGGIGAALVGVAAILAVKGHVDRSALRSSCAPTCDQSSVDDIRTTWWIAGGAAGAGVLAISLAAFLWWREPPARASGLPTVRVAPGGASLLWSLY